jgi:hypothetical protein
MSITSMDRSGSVGPVQQGTLRDIVPYLLGHLSDALGMGILLLQQGGISVKGTNGIQLPKPKYPS